MIVATWTAVETLAGDLWEACVNTRPGQLSRLDGLPRDGGKGNSGGDSVRSISVNDLRRYGYDVRGRVGTILKENFSFQTREGIRRAYRAVFADKPNRPPSPHAAELLDAINSKVIDEIAVVRNAIVHRAGVCDADYLSESEGLLGIPQVALGEPTPLDDRFVGGLVERSFKTATGLILAADRWVVANSDKG